MILYNFLKKINTDIKNVILIVLGNGIGKLIAIGLTFFLAKLFSPEDFGTLALFISLGAILTSLLTFRYEITILNTNDYEITKRISFLKTHSLILSFLFINIFILLYLFEVLDNIIYLLIPFYSLITSWYEIERMNKVKEKNFKVISLTELIRNSTGSLIPLLKYIVTNFNFGLIIGEIFSKIFALITIGFNQLRLLSFKFWWEELKTEFKHMYKLGITSFLNLINSESIIIVSSILYSPELVGLLFLSKKIVATPIGLITTGLGDIINNKFSNNFLNKDLNRNFNLFFKTFLIALLGSFFLVFFIYLFTDILIELFFNETYNDLSVIIKYSVLYYIGILVIRPISSLFNISKMYGYTLIWDIIRLVLLMIFYATAYFLNIDFLSYVFYMSLTLFIGYFSFPILVKNYQNNA
jgi:O-antigen/teichoic acid export membrane protein